MAPSGRAKRINAVRVADYGKDSRGKTNPGSMASLTFTRLVLAFGCLYCLQQCSAELKLIQAVFRHGHRNPTKGEPKLYPTDPYLNYTYPPMGPGGLTNTGKFAVYRLGEFLRARYGKFLGPIYSPDLIRFRADEVERVMMTGELVAAAMFPPAKSQRWHPLLNWQPIPIWTVPLAEDIMFNTIFCTAYRKMREELEKTDRYLLKRASENKDIYDYISEHVGSQVDLRTTFFLRQQLFAQMDIGLELPEWTKPIFPGGKLDKLAVFDVLVQSYTTEMKQLMGGSWIKEWLNHVNDYITSNSSTPQRKAFMYPAHEYNIGGILNALNSYDYKVPSYASCIVFELHKIDGKYYVQILHKDRKDVRLLEIPGCSGPMCPLEKFIEIHEPVIPESLEELCGELDFNLA